jgi:endonuclease-3
VGQHPDADTELDYGTPFELLVATILSAQSTDQGVNRVTPALFKRYPNAKTLAAADTSELERMIHATGFFRQKAKSLIGMSSALVRDHGGEVPADIELLTKLPGVGRKTANVVLGHALDVPGLLRVSNRLGIAEGDDPVKVEAQLCDKLPPQRWTRASDTLILHGRRICKPKPLCEQCAARELCLYYEVLQQEARAPKVAARKNPRRGGPAKAGRRVQQPGRTAQAGRRVQQPAGRPAKAGRGGSKRKR